MLPRPCEGETAQARELLPIDGLVRAHERAAPAGLHLDEDPAAAVTADKIDLAVSRAHVPRDDPHAGAFEGAGRSRLAEGTELTTEIRDANEIGAGLRLYSADRSLPNVIQAGSFTNPRASLIASIGRFSESFQVRIWWKPCARA